MRQRLCVDIERQVLVQTETSYEALQNLLRLILDNENKSEEYLTKLTETPFSLVQIQYINSSNLKQTFLGDHGTQWGLL